ncbi:MAG: twitching motility protein PilT [Butyrivibrio sp.]|nr:twitching motility protein PilT [Butyrivibrio sp.]
MVQLIVGKKGKGKTKCLLDKVNAEIQNVLGNVVYLDKSTKHMYELNNKIRLIVVPDFNVSNSDEFIGFISGIISQDHDLQQMYLDSFLKIACLEDSDIMPTLDKLEKLSDKFNINFVLSVSMDENELPEGAKSKVIVSL